MTGGEQSTPCPPGTRYVLAIDLGTGGPKIALVSTGGAVVAYEQRGNALHLLPGGGAEQDPEEWWRTITDGIRHLVARDIVPKDDIVAICISAQWMCTVPIDRNGNHLSNALSWMDSRGARYVEKMAGGGLEVPGTGYNARKLRRWVSLTGAMPTLSGKDPVGHILWIKHERPELYAATYKFLEPIDYLNLRLTGRVVSSYNTITGCWCTDNRDLSNVRYDDLLVSMCGLDRDKLPELVPTGTVLGPVRPEVARELGISERVQVVAGMGDTAAAGIGAGAVRDYEAHVYIGTSSWLSCHVPFKKTDFLNNITALPSGIPNRYWVATEQDVAGKSLQWLIDNLLYPRDELRGGEGAPADIFDRLNAMAARVPPGSHDVIFTPWLNGERTPVDDLLVRGGWFNLALNTDRSVLVRSVLEGVALNTRWMLNVVERFVRKQRPGGFGHINFIGGGASSPLWAQILADVLDRPIRRVADPVLANVRGAGLAVAVALGYLRWEDLPDRIRIAETHTPNPANRNTYDRLFHTFLGLYTRNKSLYAKLNKNMYR